MAHTESQCDIQTVDTSSDFNISKDIIKSFKEYSTSGLEDNYETNVAIENKHPLSTQINRVIQHKAKFFNTLSCATNVGKLLNNIPNAIVKMPTNIVALKKIQKCASKDSLF